MIFSPSIDAIFRNTNLTINEKLAIVRETGYSAFEIWGWWGRDLDELHRAMEQNELTLASMCTRMTSLVDPVLRAEYIQGLKESLEVARKLECKYLISQTGNFITDVPRERQRESLVAGLREAAPLMEEAGVILILEPLNTRFDHPGYYLEHSKEAFEIIEEVSHPHIKIVYDIYHQQISEGNLIPTINDHIDKIAYFHMADHPGRHEAGTGEIHYHNVLEAIRKTGYQGYVGMEYFPLSSAESSLNHFMDHYIRKLSKRDALGCAD